MHATTPASGGRTDQRACAFALIPALVFLGPLRFEQPRSAAFASGAPATFSGPSRRSSSPRAPVGRCFRPTPSPWRRLAARNCLPYVGTPQSAVSRIVPEPRDGVVAVPRRGLILEDEACFGCIASACGVSTETFARRPLRVPARGVGDARIAPNRALRRRRSCAATPACARRSSNPATATAAARPAGSGPKYLR
jgi:hypothetical protein